MRKSLMSLVMLAGLSGFAVQAQEIVEFHIAPGTGRNPFNTLEEPARVKVGQILRVVNDDSVVHRIHTGGRPCPHSDRAMNPGEYWDCNVTSTHEAADGDIYDHNMGPATQFYVEATAE